LKVLFYLTCSQTSIFQAGLANSGRRGPSQTGGGPARRRIRAAVTEGGDAPEG
jgi:hypothetical protein